MSTPTVIVRIQDGAAEERSSDNAKEIVDEENASVNPFDDIDMSSTEAIDKDEENEKSRSRSKCCIVSIAAAVCLLILGIIALILYGTGHMTFQEPCVAVSHFRIQDLTMESADTSSNPLMGMLDSFTGGLASQAVPTQVNLSIELTMEVNNTNRFALEYKQAEIGQVYIPQFMMDGQAGGAEDEPLVEDPRDFAIGSWELPQGELQSRASNRIPVSFNGVVDLANPENLGMVPIFMEGGAFALLTTGTIQGSSWVPGISGEIRLVCLATFDNILNLDEDAKVRCRQSLSVDSLFGEIYTAEGELDMRRLQSFMDQPTNPACYV